MDSSFSVTPPMTLFIEANLVLDQRVSTKNSVLPIMVSNVENME